MSQTFVINKMLEVKQMEVDTFSLKCVKVDNNNSMVACIVDNNYVLLVDIKSKKVLEEDT